MALQAEPLAQTRDPLAGRIPVSIVTGFLGSGKSTLINKLLQRPDMNRVAVIETTGLADPAPVMQTLMSDTMLQGQYRLDCVVTLVDAVNGAGQLDTMQEPMKQAALADRIVVTKSDLVDEATVASLEARLRELNPQAPMKRSINGEIDLAFLVNV